MHRLVQPTMLVVACKVAASERPRALSRRAESHGCGLGLSVLVQREGEEVLTLRVVALELHPVVFELVRHQLKTRTGLDEDVEDGDLEQEVAQKVEECHENHEVLRHLRVSVAQQLHQLEQSEQGVHAADEVGCTRVKLERGAL